jgi:putative transposase
MNDYQSLSHTKWECKYHVVFIPKYRRKVLYGHLRQYLGGVFRELARHKESRIAEGHLQSDHVHMLLAIPPKYGGAGGGVSQREERHSHCAHVWGARAQLCG